jgi:hypothetical protein
MNMLGKKVKNKRLLASIAITVLAIAIVLMTATACNKNYTSQGDAVPETLFVTVPDLRGYAVGELATELTNLGFTPSYIMFISDEPVDTVLSIKQMGQLVPATSTIEVHVSAGLPHWDTSGSATSSNTISESELSGQQLQYKRMEFGGISWLVLEEDKDKVLLLSEFVLFDRQYNDKNGSTTWENCTLRSYLNNEFLNSFSLQERERIAQTHVRNGEILYTEPLGGSLISRIQSWPVPAGNDTYDRVFLLSHDELREYFTDESTRKASMAKDHPRHGDYDHWWWRLRSPGGCTFSAAVVTDRGFDLAYATTVEIGVRPALWLYIE